MPKSVNLRSLVLLTFMRELLLLLGESVEALDDDEHVVDPNPEQEEWEYAMR